MNKSKEVAKHYKRKQIESATPVQLIILLYDGAIDYLNHAEASLQDNSVQSIETYHNNLIKAQDIITELISSLDMERGGEIAKNLHQLYDFIHYKLVDVNISKDIKTLHDVKDILNNLKEAWIEIAKKEQSHTPIKTENKKSSLNIKG